MALSNILQNIHSVHYVFYLTACVADIALLIDESGSIKSSGEHHWDSLMDFVKKFISGFDPESGATRFGAITFSNQARLKFRFNDYSDTSELYAHVEDIRNSYEGGNTNTTGAFWKARTQLFTPSSGDRNGVSDIIVLITDGKASRDVLFLAREVQMLKARNVTIVGVGITNSVDTPQMERIVSKPADTFYFHVIDFDSLNGVIIKLKQDVCTQTEPLPSPSKYVVDRMIYKFYSISNCF